jgi:tetratricopeptide (TPR) repeat protein
MRWKFSARNPVGRGGRNAGAARKTLYDLLGVDHSVDPETLKRAFRKAAKEHHPDLHGGDAAADQWMRIVITANEILRDPERRAAYDEYLAQSHEPPPRPKRGNLVMYSASIAVCLSFALVGAWKLGVAPIITPNQLRVETQNRYHIEAAERRRSPPRYRGVTEHMQVATAASSGQNYPVPHSISATYSESSIAKPEKADTSMIGSVLASAFPRVETPVQSTAPVSGDVLDQVIADLDQVIEREPENGTAYRVRGKAWGRKCDMDRALADYEQAIRINPNDPAIFHNRGLMWQRKGQFDKAIIDFDRAVRMSFSDAEVYNDRGAAWFDKGSYDRALADFNQALKIDPDLASAHVHRASVFERKGDMERARADREQVSRLGGPSLLQPDGR